MSVAVRNEYGAIAVNKNVIERMIIEDMLGMDSIVVLSDRKGRPIKERPTPFLDPDYYDAVDVSEKKGQSKVKIYTIVRSGSNISDAADRIFSAVESIYDMLRLDKPELITVKIRGLEQDEGGEIIRRNIDIVRNNV